MPHELDEVELDPFEPHSPPPAAQGEGTQTPTSPQRGGLDFNRRTRRATPPPPDPGAETTPAQNGEAWRDAAPAGFLAFWDAYPRQEYRAHARAAWNRKGCEAHAPAIVAAAAAYAADPNRVPQYTSAPARWLEGEGWANAPQPQRAPQSRQEAEAARVDGIFERATVRGRTSDTLALDAVEALDGPHSHERRSRALPAHPAPAQRRTAPWDAS